MNESQLDFWNIRAIAVPTQSTPSKDKSKPVVEDLEGTSVVLDFPSEQEQMDFEGYFKHAALQRLTQIDQYNLGRHVARSQSDMPMRRLSHVSPTIPGEPASTSLISPITPIAERRGSGPPTLNTIPNFPSLNGR